MPKVFAIAKGQNLINSCYRWPRMPLGRPHIAYYCNGPDGVPQYFHLWFDGKKWSAQQVSQRTVTFSLAGQGTLQIPISRPEIAVGRTGTAYVITRDKEHWRLGFDGSTQRDRRIPAVAGAGCVGYEPLGRVGADV